MENGLIIFVRNLEKGKVKSRLAKDIGDEKALDVYRYLIQYTRDVALPLHCNHFVFYSDYIHLNDAFGDKCFTKFVQEGATLGDRIAHAFKKVFELGCSKVCIIGSDCYELDGSIVESAFNELDSHDVVIGPSKDGGYYILGLKAENETLFKNKEWGTSTVFQDTVADIQKANLAVSTLTELNDIDTVEDLLETNILARLEEEIVDENSEGLKPPEF